MNKKSLDKLVGKRFGRHTVISMFTSVQCGESRRYCSCKCQCGKIKIVRADSLKRGDSKSCGCLCAEISKKANTKHGGEGTVEYGAYRSMRKRCENPRHESWMSYGGRGIKVCERWKRAYSNFITDMGPRPSPHHSLDRIDTNRGYSPNNCRWATPIQQSRNTRRNRNITIDGKTLCVSAWAEIMGIHVATIFGRLNRGWTPLRAVTVLPQKRNKCRGDLIS